MKRHLFVCFSLLLFLNVASSQDIHFTNYLLSPHTVNPALTGDFQGTYRINGIYRDQFSQFFPEGFKSISGMIDHNLSTNVGKDAWLAVGVSFDDDKSGDLSLGTNRIGLNLAYHKAFKSKYGKRLTFGLQGQFINRRADATSIITESSRLRGSTIDMDLLDLYTGGRFDASAGVLYNQGISKKTSIKAGASLFHILNSNIDRTSGTQDFIPLRFTTHAEVINELNKSLTLHYRGTFVKTEFAQELLFQFDSDIQLKNNILRLGLGYRWDDALQFLVGFQFSQWDVYGGFDMTTSSARLYNDSVGAFELGLRRIITIHPKPEKKLILLCPRL